MPSCSDYHQAQARQYNRLAKQLKPDLSAYAKSKKEWGDDATDADSLAYGTHDGVSTAGLDRMVADLEKQCVDRTAFALPDTLATTATRRAPRARATAFALASD